MRFSIPRRGKLKEGFFADVLVIDKDRVRDLSTKENPFQYSQGIDFVLVNGRLALSEGKYQGGRFGELILN
jgi:N-acyl-D-aspartate/D-glutamate deacylase